ncbi:MAG: ATP synthase F1 subunit delta [Deltaproteobacteria bacterium]|nr:ATP synthase F1 subunit delta [Deltaproteobacteria bacterium]
MKSSSLARRYAKALIGIGVDDGSFEKLGRELGGFAELLGNHEGLATTLSNPSYPLLKRRAVLKAILDKLALNNLALSKTVANFLFLILDHHRMAAMPTIAEEYQTLADNHAGRVRAEVSAAKQPDLRELDQLKKALELRTGKKVVLSTIVDPKLIAGKVTRVGSLVFDGSIRTRLDQLQTELLANKI